MHVSQEFSAVHMTADTAFQKHVFCIVQRRPADVCMEYLDRLLWRYCSSRFSRGDEFYPANRWCSVPRKLSLNS